MRPGTASLAFLRSSSIEDAAQKKKAPRSFEAGRVDLMRNLNAAQPRRFL